MHMFLTVWDGGSNAIWGGVRERETAFSLIASLSK